MWVTCENCEGEGYVFISITSDYQILHEKISFEVCNPKNIVEEYIRGMYWVNDNYEAISPPSSP